MVKFIPLLLLTGLMTATILAAPKTPTKEGLVSCDGAGKAYVVQSLPGLNGGPWITARLKIHYVLAGEPGEKYMVELWLGRTGWEREDPYHFDTQELIVPGEKGGKLREVNGKFDRRCRDRPQPVPAKPRTPPEPGKNPLFGVDRGKSWDCRLVVKKNGKVVADTGYFRAVLDPVIEI